MSRSRLEAFSDGVIAILITIMVLELEIPEHPEWSEVEELVPVFLAYTLSFVNLGIYWNNHHHMLATVDRISGGMLWANLHLLFWLSLFPFTTGWMGETDFATEPAVAYGIVALGAAIAYYILQSLIIRTQGPDSKLAAAIGDDLKGRASPILYVSAILLAFVNNWIAVALYAFVAIMWLVPDRRIETAFER